MSKKNCCLLYLFLLLQQSICCAYDTLPKNTPIPGGVAHVPIEIFSSTPPIVHLAGKRVLVLKTPPHLQTQGAKWLALVGIPLTMSPGKATLEIQTSQQTQQKVIEIKAKQYPIERLTIPDNRKVTPLSQDLKRIQQERKKTLEAYGHWSTMLPAQLIFKQPVAGRKSSPFGLKRILNGIPKSSHSGLDIAAPLGTPIQAPGKAIVLATGNYFYTGNTIFLDHGQGLITSYAHLDSVQVVPDQWVKPGDIIGTVGKTGRVTGAHLHWSISLNGVRVDPEFFLTP